MNRSDESDSTFGLFASFRRYQPRKFVAGLALSLLSFVDKPVRLSPWGQWMKKISLLQEEFGISPEPRVPGRGIQTGARQCPGLVFGLLSWCATTLAPALFKGFQE